MSRVVVSLVSLVILAGCSPQKRLARLLEKYPLPADTVTITKDTTIYRDTTFYVELPGDTVVDSVFIPVEVDLPYMELKRASYFSEATAWIRNRQLGLTLIQYDSILEFKIDSAIQVNSDTTTVTIIREVPVEIKTGAFWKHGFLVLAGLILIGLALFFLLKR